jgi:multidrug efflux pump
VLLLLFLGGLYTYHSLPSELVPAEDYGTVISEVSMPPNSSPTYINNTLKKIEKIYSNFPTTQNYFAFTSHTDGSIQALLILKPRRERSMSSVAIARKLSTKESTILSANADPFNFSILNDSANNKPVQFAILSDASYMALHKIVEKFTKEMKQLPAVNNIDSSLDFSNMQYDIRIKRVLAEQLGVSPNLIAQTVSTLFGGYQLENKYNANGQLYPIILKLPSQYRHDLSYLNILGVHNKTGELVPLSRFLSPKLLPQSSDLTHYDRSRSATVSASLAPGYTLGQAINQINNMIAHDLPSSTSFVWLGQSKRFLISNNNLTFIFLFALLLIYLLLVLQFKSFLEPFIILLTVPLSFVGAVFLLKLSGGTLNIYSKIGLLTLIGLITKHGILIVDFANKLRRENDDLPIQQVIVQAALLRFRPIIMTTMAMVFGALPLIFSTGSGANARNDIGWTIVGGMIFGTFLSLFFIPIMYLLISKLIQSRKNRKKREVSAT